MENNKEEKATMKIFNTCRSHCSVCVCVCVCVCEERKKVGLSVMIVNGDCLHLGIRKINQSSMPARRSMGNEAESIKMIVLKNYKWTDCEGR